MGELFANESMTLIPSIPTVLATITVISPASSKLKAGGSGVYLDGAQLSVSNITNPPATIPDPGPYIVPLNATAQKNKSETKLVLRENDESDTINATPKVPGSPPSDSPVSFTIKIQVAGQTKVKGE